MHVPVDVGNERKYKIKSLPSKRYLVIGRGTVFRGNDFLARMILCISAATPIVFAQAKIASPDADPTALAFEVVSIHPDTPGQMGGSTRVEFRQSRYEAEHVTVKEIIREAYGVYDLQIQHDPKWIDSESFTVDASIDSATLESLSRLGDEQRNLARQHMLQALLADRFHLIAGRETKELPIYLLTIGKGEMRLRKADPADTYINGAKTFDGTPIKPHDVDYVFIAGDIQVKAEGASVDQLVDRMNQHLSGQLGRIFVNDTGLKDTYDFSLDFKVPWATSFGPMKSNFQLADNGVTGESPEFTLFSAMKEQLGLELRSTKGPVQILSIDHIEEPSEN